jgi:hypothetical protein
MKTIAYLLIGSLVGLNLTSCDVKADPLSEQVLVEDDLLGIAVENEIMQTAEFLTSPEDLLQEEIDGLMLMREEEGLAKDVYLYFYDQYKLRIFSNIAKSETRHTNAVLSLINYFELTDPATGVSGKFSNLHLGELYVQLTAQGATLNDALAVGAFIEEYDISDLESLISNTTNADLKKVYGNLLRASGFHLKAFTNMLKFRGIIYEPQILSADAYNLILK